jgi:hypothetical protein
MAALTAAAALKILQEAGASAQQRKAPTGTCSTLCYRINGKPCNLGYLRQAALHVACGGDPAALGGCRAA